MPQLARRHATASALVERGEPRLEFAQREGLGEVVVRAGLEALELVRQRVARGQHQHRRVAVGVLAQPPAERQPVDSRQVEVEHDGVELLASPRDAGR